MSPAFRHLPGRWTKATGKEAIPTRECSMYSRSHQTRAGLTVWEVTGKTSQRKVLQREL